MTDAGSLGRAAAWLVGEGLRVHETLTEGLRTLPSDDPAPGIEVDVGASGVQLRTHAASVHQLSLTERQLAALRRGLSLLEAQGVAAVADLRSRLAEGSAPDHPAGPAHQTPPDAGRQEPGSPVVLRLSPAMGTWLEGWGLEGRVERQRDGSALLRLEVGATEDVLPWLLRLGPRVEVDTPRSVQLAVVDGAAAMAERYRLDPPEIPPYR